MTSNYINSTLSANQLSSKTGPAKSWIIESLIGNSKVSTVAGSAKVGKTHFCLQMAHSIASGSPFLGLKTNCTGVLYLMMDSDEDELTDRLRISGVQDQNLLFAFPRNLIVSNRASSKANSIPLNEYLKDIKESWPDLGVVFIDMFDDIRLLNDKTENSNLIVKEDINSVKETAREVQVHIILIMHTRKMRGSNSYTNVLGGMQTTGALNGAYICLSREEMGVPETRIEIGGRNIPERTIVGRFDTALFQFQISENLTTMDPIVGSIRNYIISQEAFTGTISELCSKVKIYESARKVSALLKMQKSILEEEGISVVQLPRTHQGRLYEFKYKKPDEA